MKESMSKFMDATFDYVSWLLVIVVLGLIVVALYKTFYSLISLNLEGTLEEFLFVLILLEIYELLSLYLRHHHVSMRRVVELGILAIVRKLMVVKDYDSLNPLTLIGLALVIFALGWIYVNLNLKEGNQQE
ncbi:phosphate-starvation-inducible PsiE family protein [Pyrococcus abyssi]|nr:phosphate-starvation-inducible PsiE family protein [Pyrococcus abyssi]